MQRGDSRTAFADCLVPDWDNPGVGAFMTTRRGGTSAAPFESMNLRGGLGDDPLAVAANHALLAQMAGAHPVFLNQVHGARVVRLGGHDAQRPDQAPWGDANSQALSMTESDASITTTPGVVCAVQVADCLPVLFAAPQAAAVGAAHAGWRGLAGGVLEATVSALCEAARCAPSDLQAWMGACIGPRQFQVGADVLDAFGADPSKSDPAWFEARFQPDAPGKWMANLPALARDRLNGAGVRRISGGGWCTVEAPSRFFSYRRDGVTGRMAALVWIERRG
jgi:YfiH family protein